MLGEVFGASDAGDRHGRVERVLEMLAAHPSTARFVCEKVVGHYFGVPADEGLVADLASVFARTGGDMREVLLALIRFCMASAAPLPPPAAGGGGWSSGGWSPRPRTRP